MKKATKEIAAELVSDHFDYVLELRKTEKSYKIKKDFLGYELMAKGSAIIQVVNTTAYTENQKKEMVKFIQEL